MIVLCFQAVACDNGERVGDSAKDTPLAVQAGSPTGYNYKAVYYNGFDGMNPREWQQGSTPAECFDDGGYNDGFCGYKVDPLKDLDWNHSPIFGPIYLAAYAATGNIYQPSMMLSGGRPDFRGARISFAIRGHNFKVNGARLIIWVAAQKNYEVGNAVDENGIQLWRRANWGYTAYPLEHLLKDGEWHRVELILEPSPELWTYAGNNPAQAQFADRYEYRSIENVLADCNVDIILALVHVDEQKRPQGRIDLDSLSIYYEAGNI